MNPEHEQLVWTVVRTVLRKYENPGIPEDDLFQEGMLALLKAERTYQAEKGAKFETYASKVIRNHLIDVMRTFKPEPEPEPGPMPEPSGDLRVLLKILQNVLAECSEIERKIFIAHFQGYSYQEICDKFGITKKKVDNTIQKIRKLAKADYAD